MGRNRKDGDPYGLGGTRLYVRKLADGKLRIVYRPSDENQPWETLPTHDVDEAKRMAAELDAEHANPQTTAASGTVAYWAEEFLRDFAKAVKSGQRSQRTHDDYTADFAADGYLMARFGTTRPERIKPAQVQTYLDDNARMVPPRLTRSNRERAALSSCLSWIIRQDKVPGMVVNPCMRASGVKRNTERKRERYVTDAEYRAVYDAGNRAVRLAMELVYRTLQRPEVDVLAWTPRDLRQKDGGRVLAFRQSKTGTLMTIALTGELGELVREAVGTVPVLHQPIVHTLKGEAYTYDGLSSMLKQAQDKVRAEHKRTGGPLADMPSFGLRDLKGKGATDMWRAGIPIERIQLLCGHADKSTTEKYIKARWTETATPNDRRIGAAERDGEDDRAVQHPTA